MPKFTAIVTLFLLFIFNSVWAQSDTHIAVGYNYPIDDSLYSGLASIRGAAYSADPFGDGTSVFAVTNYFSNGRVHLFACAGNDSIELKWTSPKPESAGSYATRYVTFGDLDNDGLVEIIYYSNGNGFYIYEWDGVPGSYNFGTQPSQQIGDAYFNAVDGYTEEFEVVDLDGDGSNELITSLNPAGSANDGFFVISADGTWDTNDPGFSGFTVEFSAYRGDIAPAYGFGGSPIAMFSAQLDGKGPREGIMHNWNLKNVNVLQSTAANTYKMADTTRGDGHLYLTAPNDGVALFGGFATDIDNDGREEAYLPTYGTSDAGKVHMIFYDNDDLDVIDSTNAFTINFAGLYGAARSQFGYGVGDIDGNGKPEIYATSTTPFELAAAEFQGGDKTDTTQWVTKLIYSGENEIYSAITYTDSVGFLDTTYTGLTGVFPSKIVANYTDFDKDGYEDIIMPYQAIGDSIDITHRTYSDTGFVEVKSKIVNPKRWSIRILEANSPATGIQAKEMTIITPDDYKLGQNYPNPFNPTTNIEFYLPLNQQISLTIYNMLGQRVKTLINNEKYTKGTHTLQWDGTNQAGNSVATGMYIYELRHGNFKISKRMMLVK